MPLDFDTGEKFLIITGIAGLAINSVGWCRQWLKERRDGQPICIKLVHDQNPDKCLLEIDHRLRRGDVTRSEVLGLLGIYSIGKTYNLEFLKSRHFLEALEHVRQGKRNHLDIAVSLEEIEVFRKTP